MDATVLAAGSYGTVFALGDVALKLAREEPDTDKWLGLRPCTTHITIEQILVADDDEAEENRDAVECGPSVAAEIAALAMLHDVPTVVDMFAVGKFRVQGQRQQHLGFTMPRAMDDLNCVLNKKLIKECGGRTDVPVTLCASDMREALSSVLHALAAMHARGIVHLDVKLQNVLRFMFGCKLADLGLAHFVWDAYAPKLLCRGEEVQTIWYRAYELLSGGTTFTAAVDVWSAGVVFADMVMGRCVMLGLMTAPDCLDFWMLLFKKSSTTVSERVEALKSGLCLNLDADGLHLMARMLDPDPTTRIHAADALHHPFIKHCIASVASVQSKPRASSAALTAFTADDMCQVFGTLSLKNKKHDDEANVSVVRWYKLCEWLMLIAYTHKAHVALGHAFDLLMRILVKGAGLDTIKDTGTIAGLCDAKFYAIGFTCLVLSCKALGEGTENVRSLKFGTFFVPSEKLFGFFELCKCEMEILKASKCVILRHAAILDLTRLTRHRKKSTKRNRVLLTFLALSASFCPAMMTLVREKVVEIVCALPRHSVGGGVHAYLKDNANACFLVAHINQMDNNVLFGLENFSLFS